MQKQGGQTLARSVLSAVCLGATAHCSTATVLPQWNVSFAWHCWKNRQKSGRKENLFVRNVPNRSMFGFLSMWAADMHLELDSSIRSIQSSSCHRTSPCRPFTSLSIVHWCRWQGQTTIKLRVPTSICPPSWRPQAMSSQVKITLLFALL